MPQRPVRRGGAEPDPAGPARGGGDAVRDHRRRGDHLRARVLRGDRRRLPLEAALAEARGAIRDEGNLTEWGTPVLYSRAPDGRLFDVTAARQDADRQARQDADRQARQDADRQARQDADRQARQDADRQATAGRRPAGPAGRRPEGPAGRRPAGPAGRRPAGPAGRRPAGPAARRPAGPAGRRPAGPAGRRTAEGPASAGGADRPPADPANHYALACAAAEARDWDRPSRRHHDRRFVPVTRMSSSAQMTVARSSGSSGGRLRFANCTRPGNGPPW